MLRAISSVLAAALLAGCASTTTPQREGGFEYEPSAAHPFGRPNPAAPPELADFAFMIGRNDCTDSRRQPNSDDWVEGERTWDAQYTMNGFAIIDTGGSGGAANGNMRVYDPATSQWQVTFFSMPAYSSGVWAGGRVDAPDTAAGYVLVLKQDIPAPGTQFAGDSTLTFSEISDSGFEWRGEWISKDGSVIYPFRRISCRKAS